MPDNLSIREAAFAAQYVAKHGNGTKAAIAAGYAPKGAHVQASVLLRRPKVKQRIARLARKHEISADRVLSRLDNLSVKAEEAGNYPAAVRAEELIGKSLGMWVDRSVNVNLDLTGQHIDAIRALASRRRNKSATAGDDALEVAGQATLEAADNVTFHNVGYTNGDDNSVIDQRVSSTPALKQSPRDPSDVDGDNI